VLRREETSSLLRKLTFTFETNFKTLCQWKSGWKWNFELCGFVDKRVDTANFASLQKTFFFPILLSSSVFQTWFVHAHHLFSVKTLEKKILLTFQSLWFYLLNFFNDRHWIWKTCA
jgi:hypothetical protein